MEPLIHGDDGLPATEVGDWAKRKHEFLRRYIDISRATRDKFLNGSAKSAAFIDLFCGPGRARVKGTDEWIDGSAVAAWKISQESGTPFSEIFVADINDDSRAATTERLRRLGAPVQELQGLAVDAAAAVVQKVNPHGLHFAFIDPFSLGALDFQIIQSLASLKRIDMLIHVSKMDHQRNLAINLTSEESAFDNFVPRWRENIDLNQSDNKKQYQIISYWKELIEKEGKHVSNNWELIRGSKRQPLYWLLLVAKHDLAHKFWKEISKINPQIELFE